MLTPLTLSTRAVVKGPSPTDERSKESLERERQTYTSLGTSSAGCFRALYDAIDDGKYLALEYLDTTLGDQKYTPTQQTFSMIKKILDVALKACLALESKELVNTDIKPANILLSGLDTDQITARVADLGLVFQNGRRVGVQPHAMRAPEVFLGGACVEKSQVWAIAAMLVCWIKPNVLGRHDSPHWILDDAWSMAKVKRLFPEWTIPSPDEVDGSILQALVENAVQLPNEVPSLQEILPFHQEMRKADMPQSLRDLLHYMLVVDLEDRPSISSVLTSDEYRVFQGL